MEWSLPYGAPSAAVWIAQFAQAHFPKYGTTKEQLAWIALNARRNAELNPNAIYREPMTMDDYLASRIICTPFSLYDCDVPCDGATAVIVSRTDRARDLAHPPLRVEAVGTALRDRPSWDQFSDLTTMANRDAGRDGLDANRPEAERRADAPGLRRVLVHHPVVDRSDGVLRSRRGRPVHRRRHSASPATACSRSIPTGASCLRAACTGTASCTRPRPRCGAKAATARSRLHPRSAPSRPVAVRPAAACSSSASKTEPRPPERTCVSRRAHGAPIHAG